MEAEVKALHSHDFPDDARIRERRRRLSLDSSLYPAGRGPRLPPSPVAGAARKMSAVQRTPFNNPFSPKMSPGQAAREFLEKTAKGQLLEIVRESDDSAGAAHHRPRRASLDDLSRVLDRYAKSRQHVFDALRGIKKQEDILDTKLENNIRRLEGTEHKFQKANKHMEEARRNSFAEGTNEFDHLQELQSRLQKEFAQDEEEQKEGLPDPPNPTEENDVGAADALVSGKESDGATGPSSEDTTSRNSNSDSPPLENQGSSTNPTAADEIEIEQADDTQQEAASAQELQVSHGDEADSKEEGDSTAPAAQDNGTADQEGAKEETQNVDGEVVIPAAKPVEEQTANEVESQIESPADTSKPTESSGANNIMTRNSTSNAIPVKTFEFST